MKSVYRGLALEAIEKVLNVGREDLLGRSRVRHIVEARSMLIYVLYTYPSFRFTQREIGEFCDRDRSYISAVCDKMQAWDSIYRDVTEKKDRVFSYIDKKLL